MWTTKQQNLVRQGNAAHNTGQVGAEIKASSTTLQLATVSVPAVYIQLTVHQIKN